MQQTSGWVSATVTDPAEEVAEGFDEIHVAMLAATAVGLSVAFRPGAARTLRDLAGDDMLTLAAARDAGGPLLTVGDAGCDLLLRHLLVDRRDRRVGDVRGVLGPVRDGDDFVGGPGRGSERLTWLTLDDGRAVSDVTVWGERSTSVQSLLRASRCARRSDSFAASTAASVRRFMSSLVSRRDT